MSLSLSGLQVIFPVQKCVKAKTYNFQFFDTINDGLITREEWIMGLNIFLKGT